MNYSYPEQPFDDALCFICDYGWLLGSIVAIMLAGYFLRGHGGLILPSPPATTTISPATTRSLPPTAASATTLASPQSPTGTSESVTASQTLVITPIIVTAAPVGPEATAASTATSQPLNYVIAFIPVHWSGDDSDFISEAQRQAQFFRETSNIYAYVNVDVKYLSQVFDEVSLSSDDLLPSLLTFGLNAEPADRYVGLTDGDVVSDGDRDVVGYTFGPDYQVVIVEAGSVSVTAHELGHTFGLCDEYNYSAWSVEDEEWGCPNPYPTDCPQTLDWEVGCNGQPARNGSNSIMGPAGLFGEYAFNEASYDHLQTVFKELFHQGA